MMFLNFLQSSVYLLGFSTLTVAHMEMIQPPPRHSRHNPTWKGSPDYDMVNPLGTYPCKGYEQGGIVQTVKAGGSIQVKLSGIATHKGGHCQFAISYDKGQTFAVLETIYSDCIIASKEYSVTIPNTAGSSKNVIFAWTWINKIGNREYYMNCADIEIQGSDKGFIVGPKLLTVNLPGYPTIPEFPQDGPNDGRNLLAARPTVTIRPNGKDIPTTTSTASNKSPTSSTPSAGICNGFPVWNSATGYNRAQKVTYKKHLWEAKWWTQKESPDTNSVWTDLGTC
ncbi:hypothetical protein K7432_008846 [Basidiobolus ranarum]|uniref:Chitin-binding type-3 domain-containing protein n=1 Tax=Basidiobolus ranarum TaxID=34480 RepID=A0ABR2WR77_9FUNG